jgi:hypothetical protein
LLRSRKTSNVLVVKIMSKVPQKPQCEPLPSAPYDIEDLFPEEPLPTPSMDVSEPHQQNAARGSNSPISVNVDRGVFTQLLTAAQQSGLTVNVDAIISARDRELRAGRYQRAFDIIDGIYAQVNAQIAQRQNALRQEELRYRSGALKMSPKDWLMRQQQETAKTQRIERARRQFARVLDGLTVLRASQPEPS